MSFFRISSGNHGERRVNGDWRLLLSLMVTMLIGMSPEKGFALTSEDDTFRPYVLTRMVYDSNLLRASKSADPALFGGRKDKSDILNQIMAGFDMDWKISNQHFIINANVNQNWYQNFTELDYLGWNTLAQWNWRLGNNFNGEIGYANIETLGNFSFLNNFISNQQNDQRYFANGNWLFHPNGKVKVGFYRNQLEFDGGNRQFNNNTEDTAELNLLYLSPTGSNLGFQFLATDGKFPELSFPRNDTLDNAYTRFNYGVVGEWIYSPKTQFYGFFGYTEQTYKNVDARNFDGFIGRLTLHWQPRDTLGLDLAAMREIRQAQNLATSFLLSQGVENTINWQIGPKIKLKLLASYQNQEFLGNLGGADAGSARQQDDVGLIGLNLIYNPTESISIEPVYNFEKRDSNNAARTYESQSAGINLKAAF